MRLTTVLRWLVYGTLTRQARPPARFATRCIHGDTRKEVTARANLRGWPATRCTVFYQNWLLNLLKVVSKDVYVALNDFQTNARRR